LRIVAGKYKGRRLFYPKNKTFRPTQDRVKETLFNILGEACHGASICDLCCGSGSLGLEALSREAKKATFIDIDITYVKRNCEFIEDKDSYDIKRQSGLTFLKNTTQTFDLIFLDPPWNKGDFYDHALKHIFEFDILNPEGLIICEHPKHINIPYSEYLVKEVNIGNTMLTLLKK